MDNLPNETIVNIINYALSNVKNKFDYKSVSTINRLFNTIAFDYVSKNRRFLLIHWDLLVGKLGQEFFN